MDFQWLNRLQEQIGVPIGRMVAAVVLLAVVYLLYRVARRGLRYVAESRKLSPALLVTGRKALRWVTAVVAFLLLFQTFGWLEDAWAALTAVAAMIAIGFVAVWSVLSNVLCSVILLVSGPFRVGDTIEIAPENWKGKVVNFTLLFTTLEVSEGESIQVPNNLFFQRVIRRERGTATFELDRQLLEEEDARV